jgi:hypothetical protein
MADYCNVNAQTLEADPLTETYKFLQQPHYSSGYFHSSLSPKRLNDDSLRFSLHRRMFRLKKGAEECKGFLIKSKFRPKGFRGGKVTADRFYKKHVSVGEGLDKPKAPLPELLDIFEVKKQKPHTVYSPKPNFVYNLSLFTKKRDRQSMDFTHVRTNSAQNASEMPIKTYTSSDFRPKQFRCTKKAIRDC